MERLAIDANMREEHNHDDDNSDFRKVEAWEEYCRQVRRYQQDQSTLSKVGLFSQSIEQRFYDQCCSCPISPLALQQMPVLDLHLRVHIARTDSTKVGNDDEDERLSPRRRPPIGDVGCSPALNESSVRAMVDMTNQYWRPAGVFFRLVDVLEFWPSSSSSSNTSLKDAQNYLIKNFRRGDRRHRDLFRSVLLPPERTHDGRGTYDVYFFDNVGNTLQGVCLERKKRNIIMGERSNKGYPAWTQRPIPCLAKTMAHELGHALGLIHTKDLVFNDGRPLAFTRGERNLMTGGCDLQGGGGRFLEQWQVCVARDSAHAYLNERGRER